MKIPAGSIPTTDPQFDGYVVEFRSQVDFLKDLARMSWVDSPSTEKSSEDEKFRNFEAVLSKISDGALERLSYENFKVQNASLTEALVKMALFIYLEEKIREFYRESESMNKDGVYALFDAVRDWTANFLTSGYFSRTAAENIRHYLMVESQFVALGELTGVDIVSIQDAASLYQKNVFQRLLEYLKKAKPAQQPAKEKKEPASKTPAPAKEQNPQAREAAQAKKEQAGAEPAKKAVKKKGRPKK
jgi:hypothetical protein